MMTTKNYNEMNMKELKEVAKKMGLPTGRSKAALIIRIKNEEQRKAAKENVASESTKEVKYAINAMRTALAAAHNLNNRHAISKEEAVMSGTTEERYNEWVKWVNDLKTVVEEYCAVKHNRTSTAEEISSKEGKCFAVWRTILKAGEEDVFHPNMFVRNADISSLVGYCETFVSSGKGSQLAFTSSAFFRKRVETLIGCRMAGNAVLTNENRNTIKEHRRKEFLLDSSTKRLNGYESKSGKHIDGIIDKISIEEKALANDKKLLVSMGCKESELDDNPFIKERKESIKKLKAQKEKTEKLIEQTKKELNALLPKVEAIENTLAEIELPAK